MAETLTSYGHTFKSRPLSSQGMVRTAVVNLARQRAAEALRAKGVNNDVIDRLPSIEDGFVTWISRSELPMEAIDEMLRARGGFVEVDDLSNVVQRTTGHAPPSWVLDLLMTSMDADAGPSCPPDSPRVGALAFSTPRPLPPSAFAATRNTLASRPR